MGRGDAAKRSAARAHMRNSSCEVKPARIARAISWSSKSRRISETGRLINIILKLIFQRAWLRRKLSESANPVFLWQDEFQYCNTPRDNFFQQTCRGARVANVCITQNILNLSEELGEQQPGSKTKSFLGNLALKIFGQQNDPETQAYAADLIGKEWRYIESFNATGNAQGASVGGAQQLVHRVDPSEFSRLLKPDGRQ